MHKDIVYFQTKMALRAIDDFYDLEDEINRRSDKLTRRKDELKRVAQEILDLHHSLTICNEINFIDDISIFERARKIVKES